MPSCRFFMLLTRELFNPVSACMICTAAWLWQLCAAPLMQLIMQAAYPPHLLLWLLKNSDRIAPVLQDYGMFVWQESTRTFLFNQAAAELAHEYQLVGSILGLVSRPAAA